MVKNIALKIIKFYQKAVSPFLGNNCRFYPSCSVYSAGVVEKYGLLKGLRKSIVRILKCHPFHHGGVDMP